MGGGKAPEVLDCSYLTPHLALHPCPQAFPFSLSHLVCRLTGHRSYMTDIRYSHGGDRLFTGSMADGAVRIWSWGAGYVSRGPSCDPIREGSRQPG